MKKRITLNVENDTDFITVDESLSFEISSSLSSKKLETLFKNKFQLPVGLRSPVIRIVSKEGDIIPCTFGNLQDKHEYTLKILPPVTLKETPQQPQSRSRSNNRNSTSHALLEELQERSGQKGGRDQSCDSMSSTPSSHFNPRLKEFREIESKRKHVRVDGVEYQDLSDSSTHESQKLIAQNSCSTICSPSLSPDETIHRCKRLRLAHEDDQSEKHSRTSTVQARARLPRPKRFEIRDESSSRFSSSSGYSSSTRTSKEGSGYDLAKPISSGPVSSVSNNYHGEARCGMFRLFE